MRVLVYKRTHTGDPNPAGLFGCNGCMGRVRDWDFEAVIGVGGIGREPVEEGIAHKITWIGIGPHKEPTSTPGEPMVRFDHFILFDQAGEDFREHAPKLAARIYGDGIRAILHDLSDEERKEVTAIVKLAEDAPPSPGLKKRLRPAGAVAKCPPRRRKGGC